MTDAPKVVGMLMIECFGEFEADLVEVLLDAGPMIDRFSISPARLYGRDLDLPKPRDRVVGSRAGLRAVVEVRGEPGPLIARLHHHLPRAGLTIQQLQGKPVVFSTLAG